MADLVVELYGTRAGVLAGTWRTFDFLPDAAAVSKFGLDSPILSAAIPLTAVAVRSRKERRQNFFRELLPEGRMLTRLAQQAGLTEQDVIGLLRAYGRDVAGALQIWDPGVPGEPRQPALEPLSGAGVAGLLEHVQDNPLGNRPAGGKTSLAGVQDKIVLAWSGDTWNRVIDGWPSTHILKPASRDYPTSIYDEEFGSRFARAAGLTSFPTWIEEFAGVPAVVIERYDRSADAPQGRIHQEDFNQVLGAAGNQKYQRYGGKVSLQRIARVFTALGDRDSLGRLFKLVVVSVSLGNLDLHAKNLSMLHLPDGVMTLSPAYDVVPQAHQPNDGEVALAIDGEYRHAAITMNHLLAEGRAWGLAEAADLAQETLVTVLQLAETETPHERAYGGLARDIFGFASNLLAGRAIGASGDRRLSADPPHLADQSVFRERDEIALYFLVPRHS
jgi:serine/threonine-protein kinase HipA